MRERAVGNTAEIDEIVARQAVLRAEIDKIVAELSGGDLYE